MKIELNEWQLEKLTNNTVLKINKKEGHLEIICTLTVIYETSKLKECQALGRVDNGRNYVEFRIAFESIEKTILFIEKQAEMLTT